MSQQPTPEPDDAELCRLVRAGDRDAADRLIRRHNGRIRMLTLTRLSEWHADYDDCLQEGRLALIVAAHTYDPLIGPFAGYINQPVLWAISKVIKHSFRTWPIPPGQRRLKADGTCRVLLHDDLPTPEPSEPTVPPWWLQAILDRLTAKQRQVIDTRYGLTGGRERTVTETAALLGISPGLVVERHKWAMLTLRREYALLRLRHLAEGKLADGQHLPLVAA